MTSPSPHPTEQLSSLLTPGENPGSFREVDFLDIASWQSVPPVNDEDKRSDTYLRSHMQGLEDCLTRLDQGMQEQDVKLLDLKQQIFTVQAQNMRLEELLQTIIQAMAEDADQDEPRTYMDGSPV